jgi:carboxylesterase type B
VEGQDQFSFKRIPYASPVLGRDRWSDSKPKTSLDDCHNGTFIAHSHNDSLDSCWRKYGGISGGSGDTEDCLTLDIFTSNVIYDPLMPVVVYIDGDELDKESTKKIRPTAGKMFTN